MSLWSRSRWLPRVQHSDQLSCPLALQLRHRPVSSGVGNAETLDGSSYTAATWQLASRPLPGSVLALYVVTTHKATLTVWAEPLASPALVSGHAPGALGPWAFTLESHVSISEPGGCLIVPPKLSATETFTKTSFKSLIFQTPGMRTQSQASLCWVPCPQPILVPSF